MIGYFDKSGQWIGPYGLGLAVGFFFYLALVLIFIFAGKFTEAAGSGVFFGPPSSGTKSSKVGAVGGLLLGLPVLSIVTRFAVWLVDRGPNVNRVNAIETAMGGDPKRSTPYAVAVYPDEPSADLAVKQFVDAGAKAETRSA